MDSDLSATRVAQRPGYGAEKAIRHSLLKPLAAKPR
jgi:hypothetical protein